MVEPNYDEILKRKVSHYGETKAAYQYAAEEYARQYFELNKTGVIHDVSGQSGLLLDFVRWQNRCSKWVTIPEKMVEYYVAWKKSSNSH